MPAALAHPGNQVKPCDAPCTPCTSRCHGCEVIPRRLHGPVAARRPQHQASSTPAGTLRRAPARYPGGRRHLGNTLAALNWSNWRVNMWAVSRLCPWKPARRSCTAPHRPRLTGPQADNPYRRSMAPMTYLTSGTYDISRHPASENPRVRSAAAAEGSEEGAGIAGCMCWRGGDIVFHRVMAFVNAGGGRVPPHHAGAPC